MVVDLMMEIGKDYHAPIEIIDKLASADEAALPKEPMVMSTPARVSRIQYPNSDQDYNLLQIHKGYQDFNEFLADVLIHEFPHILSLSKTCDYPAPQQMPSVPLNVNTFKGMNEGFAEFIRWRYSTSRGRFPEACRHPDYRDPSPMSLQDLMLTLEDKTIIQRLTTDDYTEAIGGISSSILYHAEHRGTYSDLIKKYNKGLDKHLIEHFVIF